MSDTPLTDALGTKFDSPSGYLEECPYVAAMKHARQLERALRLMSRDSLIVVDNQEPAEGEIDMDVAVYMEKAREAT